MQSGGSGGRVDGLQSRMGEEMDGGEGVYEGARGVQRGPDTVDGSRRPRPAPPSTLPSLQHHVSGSREQAHVVLMWCWGRRVLPPLLPP